ncbi:MAG: class I SAM-dependent methyltransferase [Emticicia sp.]
MKFIFLHLLYSLFFSLSCFAQNTDEKEIASLHAKCGGVYFPNKKIIADSWGKSLSFFNIKEGDNIADIGSKSMTFVGILSVFTPKANFYCEDIDSACTTSEQAKKVIDYYTKIKGEPINSTITPVIGTETSTTLATAFFDKVIIDNSLHEFSEKVLMMKDIKRILKKNGLLYLRESLGRTNGELHTGCNQALFDEAHLVSFVTEQGFKFIKSEESQILTGAFLSKLFLFVKE